MATEIRAPRLGVTVQKIRIVEWLVQDGASVTKGDPVLVFATDKVQHELEAPASGTIRLLSSVDGECPIGTVIAEIDESAGTDASGGLAGAQPLEPADAHAA